MTPISPDIISYLALRRAIGWVGLLMPFVVRGIGTYVEGISDAGSISAYYYTGTRDIFVGTLVVVGALLACYRSETRHHGYVARVAGLSAIGVALVPMNAEKAMKVLSGGVSRCDPGSCYLTRGLPDVHYVFVVLFLALCCYLVLFSFPANTPPDPGRPKLQRNRVYRICGAIMILASLASGLLVLRQRDESIFWPETIAVVAFGVAWLVKGQTVLKDKA